MNTQQDPWQTGDGDPWAGQRLPHQEAEEQEEQHDDDDDAAADHGDDQ